jgi:hypothetical protein
MNSNCYAILLALALHASQSPALAQYADPPDSPVVVDQSGWGVPEDRAALPDEPLEPHTQGSSLRLFTGPALRLGEHEPRAGLFAAVDLGRTAAGLRLSGAWVGAGRLDGVSQYGAELWLDLGQSQQLHPVLGAGAAVAVVRADPDAGAESDTTTVGVAELRASLQYQLPVEGTDARVAVDAVGSLPAVGSEQASELAPWALLVATVCVGL